MDSFTQILLGAAVGEAVAGRKAGNRAIIWGAVAGTIPDLDIFGRFFMDTVTALDFHRGVTHSILFAVVMAFPMGYGIQRIYRRGSTTWRDWALLSFFGLFTHALLDCFTTWGTKLFWPFSDYSVAFKSIFVIDPLYSLPLLICLVLLLFLPQDSQRRRRLNYIGLGLSSCYLFVTLIVKQQANQAFEVSFQQKNMPVVRYETKPSPFNIILWASNAETENGYLIGYYSFFDEDKSIDYHFFPKNHHLLKPYVVHEEVQKLLRITQGWYTIESADEGVILNDLRFGQSTGWESGTGKFVFAYHIYKKEGQVIIEAVERSFKDGKKMLKPLWHRILGDSQVPGK